MQRPHPVLNDINMNSASSELYELITSATPDWNNSRIEALIKDADPNYPYYPKGVINIYIMAVRKAPLRIIQLISNSPRLNDQTLLSYTDKIELGHNMKISAIIPAAIWEAAGRNDLAIYKSVREVWCKQCKPDQATQDKADLHFRSSASCPASPASISPGLFNANLHKAPVFASPSVMIISTGTPTASAAETGLAPGKSAQIINMAIKDDDGKNFVHVHRNKQLLADEKQLFLKNLKSGGWLVITGHGNAGRPVVTGPYVSSLTHETADIACTAKEFVTMVMQSGSLKSGDSINVALYVCYGGKRLGDKDSYAEQLAVEFTRHGINSMIVASLNPVGRLRGPGDLEDGKLRFRTDKDAIRVFNTTVEGVTTIEDRREDFFFTRNGLMFASQMQQDLSPKH